jgi:aspartokinase/homoserine dehydrogenase 1
MSRLPIIAHKFGGSSMGSGERIRRVADVLLSREGERQLVVVSAMQGVTDQLIGLVESAARGDRGWQERCQALFARHLEAAVELVPKAALKPLFARLEEEREALEGLLRAQALFGAPSADVLRVASGLGEVWSSLLLDAHLVGRGADSLWLDAREVLVVEESERGALVDWARTEARFASWLDGRTPRRLVITGFIAKDRAGRITTLGRNGSDYSGAIFGALGGAEEIHIWTDVDGVLSADPRLVPEAVLLSRLSYAEACELAYFGAKVIHPQTMAPAFARGIPLVIRNTFAPDNPGTRISAATDPALPVKGVTTFSGLALLEVRGAGMIGVPGTAERAFGALKGAGVSVVMISQGSSEHSICCVVEERQLEAGRQALVDAFAQQLHAGQIQDVEMTPGVAALAVVGDGMVGTPGIAARLFSALGRASVNVRAIAQGASERNISVAISAADAPRALRAVHAGFYLSAETLSVGVVGAGNVGQAFLRQLAAARARLLADANLDLRLRGVVRSSGMALAESLEPGALVTDAPADLDRFAAHVQPDHLPHAVIVDVSGSSEVADCYPAWLERGIHVVTASKQAGSGPWARFSAIRAATRGAARFRYEATVGAGLPIIQTLRDLIDTGDEVLAVEGMLSGTLAYLFNRFDGSVPFSQLVREARALGYTEPDPRDDLSGKDVARKLVILARELSLPTSLETVALESLVPGPLAEVSLEGFLSRLPELDAPMDAALARARAEGRVLRYVARLDASGEASVRLAALPTSHAFAHARLTDNVVQFTTRRYRDNPLVVQGPGAGPEVTAAGVFADLLRIGASLGARL